MSQPKQKKLKLTDQPDLSGDKIEFQQKCKHFVKRKKRFCKMTVSTGKEYCGEHDVTPFHEIEIGKGRIPCPLDPKHTVYANKLEKHLRKCNAKPQEILPEYISMGIHLGSEDESFDFDNTNEELKLSNVDEESLNNVIDLVNKFYDKYKLEEKVTDLFKTHPVLDDELKNLEYGASTIKHLTQTSALLGIMQHEEFLKNETCFIEFGAGKGQVSYWIARAFENSDFSKNSVVLLIDRASHRHKQDNRITDKDIVQRVRADIADLDISKLDGIEKCNQIIGIGKHLCGAATDLTIRCILKGNKDSVNRKTNGIVIALCCHHRCEWKPFVGKKLFLENSIDKKTFSMITRMVSWAICGTGFSREKRKDLEEHKTDNLEMEIKTGQLSREEKLKIGLRSKRIIDFARLQHLEENGFQCNFNYYVEKNITLENVCLVAKLKKLN